MKDDRHQRSVSAGRKGRGQSVDDLFTSERVERISSKVCYELQHEPYLDPSNIASDAIHKAWEYVARGHEVRNVEGVVIRIAERLAQKARKEWAACPWLSLDERIADPTSEDAFLRRIDQEQAASRLMGMVGRLSEEHRSVFLLRLMEYTYDEIAAHLGISNVNARVRYHRAVERLRALAAEDNDSRE